MKILRTLAVLFVLLALTVGAVAEEYKPFTKDDLYITMPEGMVYTLNHKVGHIDIVIDSGRTDWDLVATQADSWGEVVIDFSVKYPEDADLAAGTRGHNLDLPGDWTYETLKEDYDMCYDFLVHQASASPRSGGGQLGIAMYSDSVKTIIPTAYDGNQKAYLMTVFFEGTKESKTVIEAKYTSIRVTYTDESARKVERNLVPAERIIVDTVTDTAAVSDGVVNYVIENGITSQYGINIDTVIKKWDGAQSYRATGFSNIKYPGDGLTEEQRNENYELMNKPNAGSAKDLLVRMSNVKGSSDFKYAFPVIYWYDGPFDEENWKPTGKLIAVECASFYLKMGDPMPWPNYLDPNDEWYDLTKLTGNDLTFRIAKADGTKAAFAGVSYNGNIGTATVKGADGSVSAGDDLTKYNLYAEVKAPTNAKYYKYSNYFESMLLGSYYADNGFNSHKRTLDVGEYLPTNGNAIFDCDLLKEATYANDKGLKVYYDSNPTLNGVGGAVYFIEWYDENYEMISRVWFVTQFNTLANIEEVDIESSIPKNPVAPTLVSADAGNDFKLQVASFPQTSENGTQIHYELTLLKNGVEVPLDELSTDGVTLFIPYPNSVENDAEVTFKVNHYDDLGNVVDSFVEGGDSSVKLERADNGVYMTVTSLSPFVLSWEEVECEHENLTYSASGSTVTESCKDCDEYEETWTITVDETCVAGTQLDHKITHTQNWQGGEATIVYGNDAMETFTETPTVPGKYQMTVSFADCDVVLNFKVEVTAAPVMPTTGDNSMPLAALMAIAAMAMSAAFALRKKATRA